MTMAYPSVVIFISFMSASLMWQVEGNGFLSNKKSEVMTAEVEDVLSTQMDSEKLSDIERQLSPLFEVLPKSEHNTLETSTVKYALHRYFVRTHGWYVTGLKTASHGFEAAPAKTEAKILVDRAPAYIQSLLLERLHGKGMGLRELAVFAATITDLVHKEAARVLEAIFAQQGYDLIGGVTREESNNAIVVYILSYIFSDTVLEASAEDLKAFVKDSIREYYPTWDETMMWHEDLRRAYDLNSRSLNNPFHANVDTFDSTLAFAQYLSHHFGSFQALECHQVRDNLIELEQDSTGRVRLSKFYINWHFMERPDYLRNVGALDETDPLLPSVIIPNYVNSPSNCLTTSDGFFAVCCADECEGHMEYLEREIRGPTASAEHIAKVVSEQHQTLFGTNLSAAVIDRLHEIAAFHGGDVPLHGRLFAQFMHHAFPQDCSFPHVSGTVNPLMPEAWVAHAENDAQDTAFSEEEVGEHRQKFIDLEVAALRKRAESGTERADPLPWTMVEEMVGKTKKGRVAKSGSSSILRNVMAVTALVSFAVPLLRAFKSAAGGGVDKKCEPCYV